MTILLFYLAQEKEMITSLIMCVGSWDTLEVRPKEKGIDTRQELLKFYSENYSANLMHLVVYSKGVDNLF